MLPCRIYDRTLQSQGYGFRRGNIAKRLGTTLVHRQEWIMANGSIPEGMCVLHHCDTPACYELTHLFLGTHADNMADAAAKGRSRRPSDVLTHCKHGHEFTEDNTYWHRRKGFDYCFASAAPVVVPASWLTSAAGGDEGCSVIGQWSRLW